MFVPAFARVDDEVLRYVGSRRRLPEENEGQSSSGLPHHPDGAISVQAARRRQREDPQRRQVPLHARRLRPMLYRPPAETHSNQNSVQGTKTLTNKHVYLSFVLQC